MRVGLNTVYFTLRLLLFLLFKIIIIVLTYFQKKKAKLNVLQKGCFISHIMFKLAPCQSQPETRHLGGVKRLIKVKGTGLIGEKGGGGISLSNPPHSLSLSSHSPCYLPFCRTNNIRSLLPGYIRVFRMSLAVIVGVYLLCLLTTYSC